MVKLLLQTAHLLQHATGVAGRHLFGDLVVARQQGLGLGDAVFDVAEHGLALIQRRLLLQDAHRVTGHQPRFAVGRLLQPGHHPQQRRLSGSVRADHADLRPGQERQRDLVQDDVAVKSLAGVAEDQDLLHVPTPLPSRLPGRDRWHGRGCGGPLRHRPGYPPPGCARLTDHGEWSATRPRPDYCGMPVAFSAHHARGVHRRGCRHDHTRAAVAAPPRLGAALPVQAAWMRELACALC